MSDGSLINVHIMDTCGQERFDAINEQYFQKADGILLVFDISKLSSFNKIKNYYINSIKEKCKAGIPIILLGNKTDLQDQREVSQEMAINLSINEEYIYKETSCVNNENVADAFETIIEMWNIYNKEKSQKSIKKTKSKIKLQKENIRNDSLKLVERSHSYKPKIKESEDENKHEEIRLDEKKKKKGFLCLIM